ncbi:MAG: M48 family metallopeptidase [Opitutales bacterium]
MDFFERQERARKRTQWLLLYFILAVVLIIAAMYVLVFWALVLVPYENPYRASNAFWHWDLFTYTVLATLGIVGIALAFKVMELRSGGGAVARSIGGTRVDPATTNADERRLLNVVEEMAIASGTPVPEVYVLHHEPGLNAFAAGYSPDDAAVAVTKGLLESLNRDELQGVIAHEFSHILNGDMRLNIRLIGALFGIMVLAIIGQGFLRGLFYGRAFRGGSRRGKDNGGALILVIALVALGLTVIGYIGVFFGRLIQSAISRQREFLADSAAVQFTRNPDGIAGALMRIGGIHHGSHLKSAHAEEVAHMFFSRGVGGLSSLSGFFETHPPLRERIRAILPSWDGKFVLDTRKSAPKEPSPLPPTQRGSPQAFALSVGSAMNLIGTLEADQIEAAQNAREAIPDDLLRAVHETLSARAVVLCLLLDALPQARQKQLAWLNTQAEPGLRQSIEKLLPLIQALGAAARLPLVSVCVPALAHMSPEQLETFLHRCEHLARFDEQVTIFEFALLRFIKHSVEPRVTGLVKRGRRRPIGPREVGPELSMALSWVAHAGAKTSETAAAAFARQLKTTIPFIRDHVVFVPYEQLDPDSLNHALDCLAEASFAVRRNAIQFAAYLITADGEITVDETELLRAFAVSLGCPVPPLYLPRGKEKPRAS